MFEKLLKCILWIQNCLDGIETSQTAPKCPSQNLFQNLPNGAVVREKPSFERLHLADQRYAVKRHAVFAKRCVDFANVFVGASIPWFPFTPTARLEIPENDYPTAAGFE